MQGISRFWGAGIAQSV